MKRLLAAFMALMISTLPCALAEERAAYPETACLPEGALMQTETKAMRQYVVESTGETWTVLQSGSVCCAVAELSWDVSATEDEFVVQRWPGAWILKACDGEALFLDTNMSGRCSRTDGRLIIEMSFGEFRSDGRLLAAGAIAAMELYRPQATITGVELDDDDGMIIYEGEASVDGVEYEFELDAYTGRLLEWERD